MTSDDVASLVEAWERRIQTLDENLIALEAEPAYQVLCRGAGASELRGKLAGQTRERLLPAVAAVEELFASREQLFAVVLKAKTLVGERSFWNRDETTAQVIALLEGPSIQLQTNPVPVAQRGLLDQANQDVRISPGELVARMARMYEVARDGVAAVSAAWSRLEPELSGLEQEVVELERGAAGLANAETMGEVRKGLDELSAELGRARSLVATDPLGVVGRLDIELVPRIRAVRAALSAIATHKTRVELGLAEAGRLLAQLDEVARETDATLARAARETVGFAGDDAARAGRRVTREGLGPWRSRIAEARDAGHYRSADVGITRWLDVAHGLLAAEREAAQRARAGEDRRAELVGRLSARRAQEKALASKGVVVPREVGDLAHAASASLAERPTDIAKAALDVDRYDAAIRDLAGPRR
jgi:hypothetical protein